MNQNANAMPPRFPITRDEINTVVKKFYQRVRKDPVIGPVFIDSLTLSPEIWNPHEAKIADFWANAILFERSYNGNPMMVHKGVMAIKPEMFETWLDLFAEVLHETLKPETADAWEQLARRIGRGLRMGIETRAYDPSQPPVFN
jgi:hemoglobin